MCAQSTLGAGVQTFPLALKGNTQHKGFAGDLQERNRDKRPCLGKTPFPESAFKCLAASKCRGCECASPKSSQHFWNWRCGTDFVQTTNCLSQIQVCCLWVPYSLTRCQWLHFTPHWHALHTCTSSRSHLGFYKQGRLCKEPCCQSSFTSLCWKEIFADSVQKSKCCIGFFWAVSINNCTWYFHFCLLAFQSWHLRTK